MWLHDCSLCENTAHILGPSLNEPLAVLGLPSQGTSAAAAPEVRSRASTAGLQPRQCMDQLSVSPEGKPNQVCTFSASHTNGSHKLKTIKVAKWKLIFSRVWIVGKKKFHAFKKKHLYTEGTKGILAGRGCGEYQSNPSRSPSIHMVLTLPITAMSVPDSVLAFASPDLAFTAK